jgi:CHAT domain-containing protein/tetratricopeptide (TPR) repeat protein
MAMPRTALALALATWPAILSSGTSAMAQPCGSACGSMIAHALLTSLGRQDGAAVHGPIEVRVGQVVEGELTPQDPTFTSPALAQFPWHGEQIPSDRYRLIPDEAGSYTISAESLDVNPFLALEDKERHTTREQLVMLSPADTELTFEADAGHEYEIVVGTLCGDYGSYRLRVTRGGGQSLPVVERDRWRLARAHEALDHIEARYGADDARVIRCLHELASVLNTLGRSREALPVLDRAITMAEKVDPNHPALANCLSQVGFAQVHQQHYDAAKVAIERALALREKRFGPSSPDVAQSLGDLSAVYHAQAHFQQAEALAQKALQIAQATLPPHHFLVTSITHSLGLLFFDENQLERALPLLERAVELTDEDAGSTALDHVVSLRDLARILDAQGQSDRARALAEKALAIGEERLSPDHPFLWPVHMLLGELDLHEGRHASALEHLRHALEICEAACSSDSVDVATILTERSAVLVESNRAAEARADLERALSIDQTQLGEGHPLTVWVMNNLAVALLAEGEWDAALSLLERSVEECREVLGAEHPETVGGMMNLAMALERRQPERALELVLSSLSTTRRMLECQLPLLSETDRFTWAAMQRYALDLALSFAGRYPKLATPDVVYREAAAWKDLVSRGLLQERLWLQQQTDSDTLADMRRLEEVLSRLSQNLTQAEASGTTPSPEELARLAAQRDEIERKLSARSDRLSNGTAVSVDALEDGLAADEALIDVVVYRRIEPLSGRGVQVAAERRATAFVLRHATLQSVDLGPTDAIDRAVRAHRQATSRCLPGSEGASGLTAAARELSLPLRKLIWEKLAPQLEGVHRVFVVPDGSLVTLPLQTLPAEAPGRFLIEDYEFVSLPSSLELLSAARPPPASNGMLLVGGIDYDRVTRLEPGGGRVSDGAATPSVPMATLRGARPSFASLPGTLEEVRALAALHEQVFAGSDDGTRLLTGAEASEEQLKRLAPGMCFLHLATHGVFASEDLQSSFIEALDDTASRHLPEVDRRSRSLSRKLPGFFSGVVLAGASRAPREGVEDGVLTADEAAWLDLHACELVSLSACDTGLGTPQDGESLMGLRRAFRLAGARATLTSLWRVPDETTRELMIDFYRRVWTQGRGKSTALREAQLEQLASNRKKFGGEAMPGTWGAFVLEGEWR